MRARRKCFSTSIIILYNSWLRMYILGSVKVCKCWYALSYWFHWYFWLSLRASERSSNGKLIVPIDPQSCDRWVALVHSRPVSENPSGPSNLTRAGEWPSSESRADDNDYHLRKEMIITYRSWAGIRVRHITFQARVTLRTSVPQLHSHFRASARRIRWNSGVWIRKNSCVHRLSIVI